MSCCMGFHRSSQSLRCDVPACLNSVLVAACQSTFLASFLVKLANSRMAIVRLTISLFVSSHKGFETQDGSIEVVHSIDYARLAVDQDVDVLVPSVLITSLAVGMTLSESVNWSHRPSECCEPAGSAAAFAPEANLLVSIVRLRKKCCGCRHLDDDCRNKIRRSTRQTYFLRCSCNLHDLERLPSGWLMLCV